MDFLNLQLLGMHILHWLISVLLPLLLAGLAIFYLAINRRLLRQAGLQIDPLISQIDGLEGRAIENLPNAGEIFRQGRSLPFSRAFDKMQRECLDLYQGRWLPDPAQRLRQDVLLSAAQSNSLSLRPAARLLSVGILSSLASLLVQNQIPPPTAALATGLVLLPLLVGLAGALLVASNAQRTGRLLDLRLQDLYRSLENHLPVFNDQAGLSLLIDNFLKYDRQMKGTLQEFTATAGRLAESEMADGIRRSVEQVLLQSVAPSIQQATSTLGSLAGELTSRQERGMQDLASRFASALSANLAGHLQPVNKEISLMGSLMADVKNYIEYAMRALETTRQQSENLLGDVGESLRQMAEARSQLTADFAHVDEQVQVLATSASRMAELYEGNEQNLAQNLQQFSHQLDQYGQRLGSLVHEAMQAMEDARQTAAGEQDSATLYLGAMQDQVNQMISQLGAEIQNLLGQVREETAAIALHSTGIGQQLGSLNSTLDHSLNEFTQASSQYVRQTLTSFDTSLAELAGRLAQTAAEIRDAVDALPAALQQGQGQVARFGE